MPVLTLEPAAAECRAPDYELHCGDCHRLLTDVAPRSVDLVLVDAPYGATQVSWDQPLDWPMIWEQYRRILKPQGTVALFAIKPFTFVLGATAPKGWFRYDWIYEKSKASNPRNAKIRPMRAHEEILIFSPKAPRYFPQMRTGLPYNKGLVKEQPTDDLYGKSKQTVVKSEDGRRYPRSVIYFKTAEAKRQRYPLLSKTQKPVDLLEYLIHTYTQPGDTVLDHCMGSGATGVASLLQSRRFLGMERDPLLFEQASDWISKEHDALHSTLEP